MPLNSMMGGMVRVGGEVVDMPTAVNRTNIGPALTTVLASVTFKRNGTIVNDAGTVIGNWVSTPHATVGDQYQVKHTRISGDTLNLAAAADDTYITMSSDRDYGNSAYSSIRSTVGTFSIRQVGGSSAIDTATSTIYAESS